MPSDGPQRGCSRQVHTQLLTITVNGGTPTPIPVSESPIQGGSIGGDPAGGGVDSAVYNAVRNALEALKKPLCRNLFGANVNPSALLQSLYIGLGPGAIFSGELGGIQNDGTILAAVTEPIMGTISSTAAPATGTQGAFISYGPVGATISVNSNPAAPFTAGWATTVFGGYSNATVNAATIIHELGHAANLINGAGSSVLPNDGPEIPNGPSISQNTQLVLDKCFPK